MLTSLFYISCREDRRLHSVLDPLAGVESLGYFPVCFIELASVLAPKLGMVFCRILLARLFLSQCRCADDILIP